MKRVVLAGAALALVLAVACGSGDDDATVVSTSTVVAAIESAPDPTSTATTAAAPQTSGVVPTVAPTSASQPEPTSTTAPAATSAPASPTANPTSAPQPTAAPTPTSIPLTATSVPPTATATPVPPTPVATPSSESLVHAIARVLAAREFGVSNLDVNVDSSEPTVWPDEALGCVVPGKLYSSGTVEGWLLTVSAGSESLEYHSDATGDEIFTCAEAERVSSLPSINVVDAAGLTGVTSIIVSAEGGTIEVVRVEDADPIGLVLAALSEPTHLSEASGCDSLFQLEFVTASGSATFEYACSGQSQLLRGTQAFWGGSDGISPAGFQRIINAALAARVFPGFPPTP